MGSVSQKPNPTKIKGEKVFCAFWGPKLNPLGGQVRARGGRRRGQWCQLGVRPLSWEPRGTEPRGGLSTWCPALNGTWQKAPPSCKGQRCKAVSRRQLGRSGFCEGIWRRKPACLGTTSGRLFPACSAGTQLYERRH